MSRPRIAIRAFTCRRDVAPAELLAQVLRKLGCDVLVCSMRDFNRTLKLWRPHVAVVNTPGQAGKVRKVDPDVAIAWLDGEGFLPPEFAHAVTFSKDAEMFRASDLALVWGRKVRDELCAAFPEEAAKVHVVGNPAYDLIRYRDREGHGASRQSVGIVMRFGTINNHSGIPPTRTLPNPGNLDRVLVECRSFVGAVECVRHILRNTDFNVSLRPHPLEQIESYELYRHMWFEPEHRARVSLDKSLSFSHWASEQLAILSPTSATLLEAYLLGIPVINVDSVSGTDEFMRDYAEITKTWQEGGLNLRSYDELVEALNSFRKGWKCEPVAALDRQLEEFCSYHEQSGSACLAAARHIEQLARSRKRAPLLPMFMVDRIDAMSFRRIRRKEPLHPNMNYRRGYHALPADLDHISDNILRSGEGRSAAGGPDPEASMEKKAPVDA